MAPEFVKNSPGAEELRTDRARKTAPTKERSDLAVMPRVNPAGSVTFEPLDRLNRYRQAAESGLSWGCPFMLPAWLGPWWSSFGGDLDARLCVVRQQGELLGLVPMTVRGDRACLIGDPDLIDYSDFVVAPSREPEFFPILLRGLRKEGIRCFTTGRIRADAPAVSFLETYAAALRCDASFRPVDVLYEMELPESWEAYLDLLQAKERHETRRKLRRLENAGTVSLRALEDASAVPAAMDAFVTLFRSNRPDKAQFMTDAVEAFFRNLAAETASAGLLRLFSLDVNRAAVAMAMCFDHGSTIYLYNNGFDRRFSHLSVGLLCTVLSIRDSILRGRKRYSFLRGSEPYKRQLGGQALKLLRGEVRLR